MPNAPDDRSGTPYEVAAEATRSASRWWWSEAQKIAEQVDEPSARWEILLTAMRKVGWPTP